MNKNIGAAIIVKNGEKTIAQALQSLNRVCRQIVVVDTGSQDSTPSIVARLGAELYFHKWNDDFSEALNYSLQFIRTEWTIILDADEELNQDSYFQQCFLLDNPATGGVRVKIENILGGAASEINSTHKYPRIFRNLPEIRFEGKIHEQISDSINRAGLNIVDSDIRILHKGYSEVSLKKIERNRGLLNTELVANPHDGWLKYHLAETEFAAGNLGEAEKLFTFAVNSGSLDTEQAELSKIRLGQIALAKDDYINTENLLNFKSSDINREGLRKYVLAASYLMQKKFSEALTLYKSPEIKLSGLVDKSQLEEAIEKLPVIRF